jgi:RHS repeat-associated protein
LSFSGQDQDTVSGMHDFLDRRYMPVQGRWLTPDPTGLTAVNPANPQSWNRYAYVQNNPLSMIDPFGDDGCYDLTSVSDASCSDYYGPGSVSAALAVGGGGAAAV